MSCPLRFAPQFLVVGASNVEAVAANDVALLHYGQKAVYNTRARVKTSGVRTLDDEQWQTSFDSDHL